jgi:hypothetical protein
LDGKFALATPQNFSIEIGAGREVLWISPFSLSAKKLCRIGYA